MELAIRNVTKIFDGFTALDNISLNVRSGELIALLGPSGSGKTTLLRLIAGLDFLTSGQILFGDEDASAKSVQERNVGFVFQHYALFRHMTVLENVSFGLKIRPARSRPPAAEIRRRALELLDLVQLTGLENRYPNQLSGGQRQRVALARALCIEPRVLLLDEPFGALDAQVRRELRRWLREIHDATGHTSIFVTHDQEEAFEVADQVVVMRNGRVEQTGTPQEVFDRPATPFVMDFLGNVNVFHGRVENGRALLGGFEFAYPDHPHPESCTVSGYVRPHELHISTEPLLESSLAARVLQINPAGSVAKVRVSAEDFGVILNIDVSLERYAELGLTVGDRVYVAPKHVRIFSAHDYVI